MKKIEEVILQRVDYLKKAKSNDIIVHLMDEYMLDPVISALLLTRLVESKELKPEMDGIEIYLTRGAITPEEEKVFKAKAEEAHKEIDARIHEAEVAAGLKPSGNVTPLDPSKKKPPTTH